MPSATIEIDLNADAFDAIRRLTPERVRAAMVRGLDRAAALTVADIQAKRLTGQGPFPVSEGRLGVRSGRLRQSLRPTPAVVTSEIVRASIGSNVAYAGIHEFGGTIKRTVKPGSVRLRTDRQGNLMRRNGNLATFARGSHKQVKVVAYAGGKNYEIVMPARAPIGHGVTDNAETFEREIAQALNDELRGGAPTV